MLVGPAIGGVLIGTLGLSRTYLIDVATYGIALLALWRMRPSPPEPDSPPFGLAAIREGLRFLKGKPVLQSTYLADLNAMIYSIQRLPDCIMEARDIVLGQTLEAFAQGGSLNRDVSVVTVARLRA